MVKVTELIEMGDKNVFNTTGSQLWKKVVLLFDAELKTQYSLMRQDRFTVDNIMKYLYGEQISQIPAYYYNKDMQSKYLNFGSSYLYALHGSGEQHIRKWIRERLMYCDTLLGYRASSSDYITLRSSKLGEVYLDVETYIPMYLSIKWRDEANNTGLQTKRVGRGEKVRFTYNMPTATDQEIIVYAGHYLKSLGDVSNLQPTSMLIANADRLTEIVCHSPNLINTDLSECTKLQRIDLSDCTALGTGIGAQPILNIQNCKYLRYCDCRNTQLTAIYTMQAGGNLEEIYYPQSTQVVQLTNQTYLHTIGLPSTNPCENLADVQITNCNAVKSLSSETIALDFNTFKYVQNLNITNSLRGLNSMQFNGFDKLRNVTLSSLKELNTIGFEDMMPVTTTSTLKNITISDCPLITSLSFNVSSDDYKVAFASNGKLDLGGLQSLKSIKCNTSVKGLDTLIVPTSLTELRFTTEHGDGINEIKNIWSASAVHNNDGFEGIDFQDMTIEFIDMLGLNSISNAINFHIAPKTQNPNLNTARDGSASKPWFHPIGSIDLSNYTGLMIGMLRGIDLNKLDVVINTDRDQVDLTSLFECATLPTSQNIVTKTNNILAKFPKSVIWDYMFKGCDLSFSPKDIRIPNRGLSLKGMYKDSNVTEDVSLPNVIMAVDEMFMNCTGITTYEKNWLKTYSKITYTVPTSNGTSGSWDDSGNYTEGTDYNQFLYTPSDGEKAFKIMTTGTGVVRINYFYNASFISRVVYTPEFDSYPYVVTIPDGCNKVIFVCDKTIGFANEGTITTNNCYTNTGGALSEIPTSWGGYGLDKNVTSIYVIDTTFLTNTTTFNLVLGDNQAGITDWGDGVTNSEKSHTYAEHGTYTIKTKSSSHGYAPSNDLQTALIEIKQIKLIGHNGNTQNYSQMFLGCGNLRKVTAYNLAPSNCNSMFKNCSSLVEIVGMDTWNMSNCNDIGGMFSNCSSLTSIDFIKSWNLSNVGNIGAIFDSCKGVKGELILQQFNMPKCTSVGDMFRNCTGLTSLDVTGWNIPLVQNINNFVAGCSNLITLIGTETWNMGSNLRSMDYFINDTKITELNLSNWDFTYTGSPGGVLYNYGLTTIILNNVTDNVAERTSSNGLRGLLRTLNNPVEIVMNEFAMRDFSNLFQGVTKIKNDIVFPTNATNVSNCFKDCTGMTHIHSNWKTTYDEIVAEDGTTSQIVTTDCYLGCTGVTHCDGVECYKLDEVPISWGGYGLFKDRTLIVEINIPEDNYTIDLGQCYSDYPYTNDKKWYTNFGDGSVDVGYHDGSGYVNTAPISHTYAKAGTYILKTQRLLYLVGENTRSTFIKIINAHSYLGVWGIREHFKGCGNLVEADLSNLAGISFDALALLSDCPKLQKVIAPNFKPKDCQNIFNGCSSLTEIIGLDTWDMSLCTSLSSAYNGCASLTDDVFSQMSDWDVSNIDNYGGAFMGCKGMTTNSFMAKWVMTKTNNFYRTFAWCNGLTEIILTNKYITNNIDAQECFYDCSNLTTLDLTNLCDTTKQVNINSLGMFNGCSSLSENPYHMLMPNGKVNALSFLGLTGLTNNTLDCSSYDTSGVESISPGEVCTKIIGISGDVKCSVACRYANGDVEIKDCYFKLQTYQRFGWFYYGLNSATKNIDVNFVTKEGEESDYKVENMKTGTGVSDIMKFTSTAWTVNSFVSFFNCLYDYASEGTSANYILNIGDNFPRLTTEQILVASVKGWCIKGTNVVAVPSGMDLSSLSTDTNVTKVYVGLTSENATSRIAEIYTKFPNITEIYLFEDGSITEAVNIFTGVDNSAKAQITKVVFLEGYFNNVTLDMREYGILDELPTAWGGYGFSKDVTSIYVVNIPSDNFELNISNAVLNRFGDGLIDWGDGTVENETYGIHTYTTAGIYTIKTKCQNGGNGYTPQSSSIPYIIEVKQIATNLRDLYNAFNGLSNLTKVTAYNLTSTNCKNMFENCSSLTEIIGMDTWNMSNCTSIDYMFRGCTNLINLNISNWNVSNISSFAGAFFNCRNLSVLNVSNWRPINANNMQTMFKNCSKLTELNISNWGTLSKVSTLYSTFDGCSSLTELVLPTFTSTLTDMETTFAYCTNLTTLDISNCDLSNTVFRNIFNNTTNLTNISSGTNINNDIIFSNCNKLTVTSLLSIINNLATVTGSKTLTLGSTNLAKLTDEQIAIATNKGWTIQ